MKACSRTGEFSRSRRWLQTAAMLATVWSLLVSTGVCAQNGTPTVTAKLVDTSVDVAETTQYQIVVSHGEADAQPPAPMVAGLAITSGGETSHSGFFMDNGGMRMVDEHIYLYNVIATRSGRYVIPGQQVMVNGLALRTQPVTLSVGGSGADGSTQPEIAVRSELIVPKKRAYVGESIPIELRGYFGTAIRAQSDPEPVLTGEGFSVQKFTAPAISVQTFEGFDYNTATYKSAITGAKIGNLTIGPAETEPIVQLPLSTSRRARSFDQVDPRMLLNLMQPKQRVKVSSAAVSLEILPLPPGKPASFTGGIGQFKLDVEAEPRQAQAGDPVTVRLILSGQGNFDRVGAPTLADENGLKVYPPKPSFKPDDEVGLSGVKIFEQVVIADGARVSLPAYRFSYLDLATGKYVSLDTSPVAVKISGGTPPPVPTVALVPQNNPAPTPTPSPTPTRLAEDILYIRSDPGSKNDRSVFLPIYQRRDFWLAQLIPLALVLAAGGGMAVAARVRNESSRRHARLQREKAELQRALRKEDTPRRDFYLAATRLAQLRAAAGRMDSPLTATEICQARGLNSQVAELVQNIFHRHDELAYSGGEIARESVPAEERRGVLATLEVLEKNGK